MMTRWICGATHSQQVNDYGQNHARYQKLPATQRAFQDLFQRRLTLRSCAWIMAAFRLTWVRQGLSQVECSVDLPWAFEGIQSPRTSRG